MFLPTSCCLLMSFMKNQAVTVSRPRKKTATREPKLMVRKRRICQTEVWQSMQQLMDNIIEMLILCGLREGPRQVHTYICGALEQKLLCYTAYLCNR